MNNIKTIIYIKYGELTLKGKNRKEFIKCLANNVKRALKSFLSLDYEVNFDNLKISNLSEQDLESVINILKQVYGISSFSIAYETPKEMEIIKKAAEVFVLKNKKTFKIEARRTDKNFHLNSNEIKLDVAKHILSNYDFLSVDIHNPELLINIEIKHNFAVVYGNKIEGAKGLPVGINGRALVLLSGGIDSPVAARLIMKRGIAVDFITFITPPHTSDKALEKVIELAQKITLDAKLTNSSLYVCNFTPLQEEISHISKESYRITIMRRYFMRIAKRLAKQINAHALVTGEALGQVASQTLSSIETIANVLEDFVVFKPLISFDKQEIIELALKFDTYHLSIQPYDDSCSLFAPKNPTTNPNVKVAQELENESFIINDIYEMVYREKIQKIKIEENYVPKFTK